MRTAILTALMTASIGASAQLDRKAEGVKTPDAAPASPAPSSKYAVPAKPGPPPPVPPPLRDYGNTSPSLVDGQASAAAKSLYKRMRAAYGKRILLGHTSDKFDEFKALSVNTPIIRGWDMMYYSPGNPWNGGKGTDDGSVKSAIAWHGRKGIVTFVWHWYSPSGAKPGAKDPYRTDQTDFDVSKAVTAGTPEHAQVVAAIDEIAVPLKRLSDAGVPVLWRPLHEAAGGTGGAWFWWGAKGPGPCLKLYDLMYDRLTNHHQLHNLIWVWSEPNPSWYPGNGKVDVVGYDSYPGKNDYSSQKATFDKLYQMTGGQKLIALTETGPLPGVDAALKDDAKWAYVVTWAQNALNDNDPAHVKDTYAHPAAVTLESK